MLAQAFLIDPGLLRQGMLAGHVEGNLTALLHGLVLQVRRVVGLHLGKGDLRPAALHQGDQVFALGNQAFQLEVRVTLLEGAQAAFEAIRLVGVRQRHREFRLNAPGQLAGGHFQAAGGSQDCFGTLQQHMPGRGEAGLAAGTVEKLHVEVDLQAGHRRADGGLALAQLARGSGKGTLGGCLDKRQQHFM